MNLRLLFGAGMALCWITSAQTNAISGFVTDEAGKPLSSISVYAGGLPSADRAAVLLPITFRATTDTLGVFTIQNVPAGLYQLCALAGVSGQVSSCEWGQRPVTASVAASSETKGLRLIMGSGDVVRIHVQDTNAKLIGGVRFSVGIISDNGISRFGKLVKQKGQVFDYEVTIPKGRVSRLVVNTPLQVSDAIGAAVQTGRQSVALAGPGDLTLSAR